MRILSLSLVGLLYLIGTASGLEWDPTEMLCQVNTARAGQGLPALGWDDSLASSAQDQANYMANQNTLSHEQDSGSDPATRAKQYGYAGADIDENVADGADSVTACMQILLNSPGHYANIMDPKMTNFGCAMATTSDGHPFYCQDFGGDSANVGVTYPSCPSSDSSGSSDSSDTSGDSGTVTYTVDG